MSLASLFTIACVIILWTDRKDWFNYLIVALAALFFGGTAVGDDVGPWIVARATDIDNIIKSLFAVMVLDPSQLLRASFLR